MLIKIFRFLFGCVSVRVYGGFFEGFINLCNTENLSLWDISYIDNSMYFYTNERSIGAIKKAAEEYGLEWEIGSYSGLPYAVRHNRSTLVLVVGVLASVLFIGLMNTRIWSIELSGNEKLFDSEIYEIMEEQGVKIGAKKSSIDVVEVQNDFLKRTKDKIIWVSLNIEGMCAEVQVREIKEFKDDSIGIPCNYVADFSGIITTYRVFSGTPVVDKGSYVRKGDLLISSVVEYYDGDLNFVESRGKIIARRDKKIKTVSAEAKQQRKYTEEYTGYALSVFGKEIPLTYNCNDGDYEVTKEAQYLCVNGHKLPFGLVKYTYSNYVTDKLPENDFLLLKHLKDIEYQTQKSNVIKIKTSAIENTDGCEYFTEIDCLDILGKKVPLDLTESE